MAQWHNGAMAHRSGIKTVQMEDLFKSPDQAEIKVFRNRKYNLQIN
jgi:hypothetical protein